MIYGVTFCNNNAVDKTKNLRRNWGLSEPRMLATRIKILHTFMQFYEYQTWTLFV